MPKVKGQPAAKRAKVEEAEPASSAALEATLRAEDAALQAERALGDADDGGMSDGEGGSGSGGDSLTEQLAAVLRALQTSTDRRGVTLSELAVMTGIVSEYVMAEAYMAVLIVEHLWPA